MSTKRRIVVAELDAPIGSIVNECPLADHFDMAEFDENTCVASTARGDRVIFTPPKELEQTQARCVIFRSRIGDSVPLLCCAGRYIYLLISRLLGSAVQSMIIMPFDARELRKKLDELDLGFLVERVPGDGW